VKKYIVPITAITAIVILEIVAVINGINGAALLSGTAIVAGIAGYTVGNVTKTK